MSFKALGLLAFLAVILVVGAFVVTRSHRHSRAAVKTQALDLTKLPGTIYEVTYTPQTVTVDSSLFRKGIRNISKNRAVLVFDSTVEPFGKLSPGSVLLVEGSFVRRVLAVEKEGPLVAVATGPAGLTDFIRNGHLKWSYPVNFQSMATRAQFSRSQVMTAGFGDPLALGLINLAVLQEKGAGGEDEGDGPSGKIGGWDYTIQATPTNDRLNIELELKKEVVNATTFEVKGEGYVDHFQSEIDIVIKERSIESFQNLTKGLKGNIEFTWSAGTEATGPVTGEEDLKLPAFFKIPLEIGPIPFDLEIGSAVLFKPGFTGKGELAKGEFRVEYSGDEGLTLKGGNSGNANPGAQASSVSCETPETPSNPGVVSMPGMEGSLPGGTEPPSPNCNQPNPSGVGSLQVGSQGKVEATPAIVDAKALSAIGPVGLVVGVAIPRIELKTGTNVLADRVEEAVKQLVPSSLADRVAQKLEETTIGSHGHKIVNGLVKDRIKTEASAYAQIILSTSLFASGPNTLIPCQWSELIVSGKAGVELSFFGRSIEAGPPLEHEFLHMGRRVDVGKSKACGNESAGGAPSSD